MSWVRIAYGYLVATVTGNYLLLSPSGGLSVSSLDSLNIAWTSMSRDAIVYLVTSLPPTLTRLNLSGYRDTLHDEGKTSSLLSCIIVSLIAAHSAGLWQSLVSVCQTLLSSAAVFRAVFSSYFLSNHIPSVSIFFLSSFFLSIQSLKCDVVGQCGISTRLWSIRKFYLLSQNFLLKVQNLVL